MTYETPNLLCRNCKFWWPITEGKKAVRDRATHGQCRRHAPPALLSDSETAGLRYPSWATTVKDDWCGEHVHREI